jgi:hypothetical protein
MRGRPPAFALGCWLAASCASHPGPAVDASPPAERPSLGEVEDPCPALAALYSSCGIPVSAVYVDDCRRNFTATAPDNLAFRCSETCVYGARADGCEAVRVRDNARSCVACCAPVLAGRPSTCGGPSSDASASSVDAWSPDDAQEAGADTCRRPSCAAQVATCAHSQACSDLLDCLVACKTKVCTDGCRAQAPPDAVRALQEALDCESSGCADASVP